jgi:hypothetical protein
MADWARNAVGSLISLAYWLKRLAVTGPVRDAAAVERRDQGGPAPDAGGDCSAVAGQVEATRGKARSRMSFTSLARLPPWRMMTSCSSRHSGWLGMMPRSRQMSRR